MYKFIDQEKKIIELSLPESNLTCRIILGSCPSMNKVFARLSKLAPTNHPVLILGPTGSGKEWAASFLHAASELNKEPFIDVNCGTISHDLFESLVFGHTKGAFSGAHQAQAGLLEQVGKGTLFLDEIGELPLDQQPKLLRALETRQYRPVGARESKIFNGRIIAATHRDLEDMIACGSFREDLYHRISACKVNLPALKERKEDIPLLAQTFAEELNPDIKFDSPALSLLQSLNWPGNIRQLKNTIRQLSVFADNTFITQETLKDLIVSMETPSEDNLKCIADDILLLDIEGKLRAIEHALIEQALMRTNGQKTKAAMLLGIHRKRLERHCKQIAKLQEQLSTCLSRANTYLSRGKYKYANLHFQEAESILIQLPENKELNQMRSDVHIKQSICQRNLSGWNALPVTNGYKKANSANKKCGDVLFGQWAASLVDLNLKTAEERSNQLLTLGTASGDQYFIGSGIAARMNTLYWLGQFEECHKYAKQYVQHYHFTSLLSYDRAFDPFPIYLEFKFLSHFHQLELEDAQLTLEQLIRYESNVINPFIKALTLHVLVWLYHLQGKHEPALLNTHNLLCICDSEEFLFYKGFANIFKGYYQVINNKDPGGIELMKQGFYKEMHQNKGLLFNSYFSLLMAEALLKLEDSKLAIKTLNKALDIAQKKDERPFIPQIYMQLSIGYFKLGNRELADREIKMAWNSASTDNNYLQQLTIIPIWLEQETQLNALPLHELEVFLLKHSNLNGSTLYNQASQAFHHHTLRYHYKICQHTAIREII